MKAAELRDKSAAELKTLLGELRRKQFKLRLVKGSGELEKTHEIKDVRRQIARLETVLTQKEGKRDE